MGDTRQSAKSPSTTASIQFNLIKQKTMNNVGSEEIEEQRPVDVVKQLELDDSDDDFDENEYLMTFDQYN